MTSPRETDTLIKAFLAEGQTELPDRAYDAIRAQIDHTRQRVVIGPWREEQMSRFATFAIAAAAVVLIAVIGIRFLPTDGGVGAQPTASPTPNPTASPSPTPTASPSPAPTVSPPSSPIVDPETGQIEPGTYVAHPFEAPNDGMSFTFTVPSNSWETISGDAVGDETGMVGLLRFGESGGLGMGFHWISSLNGDPCNWSGTADDVAIGPTVDDLVAGLTSSTEYETSDPTDVSLGGHAGKKLVVTMPSLEWGADGPTECDETEYIIWNTAGGGYFDNPFGPESRWTLWILDVDGQAVVIKLMDFEDSPADLRQELQSIVDSIVITAP